MDEIEIKITFIDNLFGCEITKSGKAVQFETFNSKEQVKICNALAQSYNLFAPCIKEGGN